MSYPTIEEFIGNTPLVRLQRLPGDSDWQMIEQTMAQLQVACDEFDEEQVQALLYQLVPELSEQQALSVSSSNENNVVEFSRR